jgi:hypothetical protein
VPLAKAMRIRRDTEALLCLQSTYTQLVRIVRRQPSQRNLSRSVPQLSCETETIELAPIRIDKLQN